MNTLENELQSDHSTPVEVVLRGHLTAATLTEALHPVGEKLRGQPGSACLLFDCRTMTGYDREARQMFVDWHRGSAAHVLRIAIVTDNPLWPLVVSTMALATGKQMKAFSIKQAALNWLLQMPHH